MTLAAGVYFDLAAKEKNGGRVVSVAGNPTLRREQKEGETYESRSPPRGGRHSLLFSLMILNSDQYLQGFLMNDTNGSINYAAVLTDLERKRSELDSAISAIRAIAGMAPVASGGAAIIDPPAGSGGIPLSSPNVRSDSFVGMSIVDASKKYLGMVKAPQSTAILVEILGKGGVPKPVYNTVFAVLARQERLYGDVVKLPSKEWALAEWYPGAVKRRSKKNATDQGEEEASEASE